jgi:uncharacterized Zn finger protein
VIELELEKGSVTAMVQGSRDAPYLVRMRFSMLSSTDWKKVMRAIGEDPALGGPLLLGEMPENIEDAFREQELSLFPTASGDLKAACSCPDQANPCKHVAAVYYLLAQEFDRDPFLIFRLRGMDRTEIATALADTPAARATVVPPPPRPTAPSEPSPTPRSEEPEEAEMSERAQASVLTQAVEYVPEPAVPEPLPTDAHEFWAGGDEAPGAPGEVRIPTIHAALSKRLGGFSFWRGEAGCDALMERIYQNASLAGLDVFLCESDAGQRS